MTGHGGDTFFFVLRAEDERALDTVSPLTFQAYLREAPSTAWSPYNASRWQKFHHLTEENYQAYKDRLESRNEMWLMDPNHTDYIPRPFGYSPAAYPRLYAYPNGTSNLRSQFYQHRNDGLPRQARVQYAKSYAPP